MLYRSRQRVGPVFQGRYKSIVVDKESYLLELCRYVVLNPVRARVSAGRGVQVFESLKGGVLVKCLHGSSPLLEDCLRVTVGTPDENRAFLSALRAVL